MTGAITGFLALVGLPLAVDVPWCESMSRAAYRVLQWPGGLLDSARRRIIRRESLPHPTGRSIGRSKRAVDYLRLRRARVS